MTLAVVNVAVASGIVALGQHSHQLLHFLEKTDYLHTVGVSCMLVGHVMSQLFGCLQCGLGHLVGTRSLEVGDWIQQAGFVVDSDWTWALGRMEGSGSQGPSSFSVSCHHHWTHCKGTKGTVTLCNTNMDDDDNNLSHSIHEHKPISCLTTEPSS